MRLMSGRHGFNWRINDRLCVRVLFGLWLPWIWHNPELKYWAMAIPGVGVAFDYEIKQ